MAEFLSLEGLSHFKEKQDSVNNDKIQAVKDAIPSAVSALTNDSGYQTESEVKALVNTAVASSVTYKGSVDNKAALPTSDNKVGDMYNLLDSGMNVAWTGSDWDEMATTLAVDSALSDSSTNPVENKAVKAAVDAAKSVADDAKKVADANAEKLKGMDEGANKYTHPTYDAHDSGFYKVTVDGTGHVSGVAAVAKLDITSLGIPAQDTTYSDFGGASATDNGKAGLVPAPSAGSQTAFLCANGTWTVPAGTTYSAIPNDSIDALF